MNKFFYALSITAGLAASALAQESRHLSLSMTAALASPSA